MKELIGHSLGRYQIIELLGAGGMAAVYKAFDPHLERFVAIKVIFPGFQHSTKFLKRFETEAKALAQLAHANIVRVLDYGEHDGIPYLVMEYISGGTLKDRMRGPMNWRDACKLLIPVGRALGYVHQQKIVHRDVKPANILMTDTGQPTLTDFGIIDLFKTEKTEELAGTSVGLGTPEYMSPEQASGHPVTHLADIYALGVIFYEMLTGRKPIEGDTAMAVVIKQALGSITDARRYVLDLPKFVTRVMGKALAKNPKRRYQTMEEFVRALESIATRKVVSKKRQQRTVLGWSLGGIGVLAILLTSLVFSGALPVPGILGGAAGAAEQAQTETALALPGEQNSPTPEVAVGDVQSPDLAPTPTPTIRATDSPIETPVETQAAEAPSQETTEAPAYSGFVHADTPYPVTGVSLSSLLDGGDTEVVELSRIGFGQIEQVAWAQDGSTIAVGTSVGVFLVDSSTQRYRYLDTGEWISCVAISPNSTRIVSGSVSGSLIVWDINTREIVATLEGHTKRINSLAFSYDGQYLASSAGDGGVRIWDANTWQEVTMLSAASTVVNRVAFSPDSLFFLTGSADGGVRVWSVSGWEVVRTRYHQSPVTGVAFSNDSTLMASSDQRGFVTIVTISTGEILADRRIEGSAAITSLAISPDNTYIAVGLEYGGIAIWRMQDQVQYWQVEGRWYPPFGWTKGTVGKDFVYTHSIAFSPDSQELVSATWDGSIRIYNLLGKALDRSFDGQTPYTYGLVFSPDDATLLIETWNEDGLVRLWDVASNAARGGIPVYAERGGYPFSPDGEMLALNGGLYDHSTGEQIRMLNAYVLFRYGGNFSVNDQLLAFDGILWDLEDERLVSFQVQDPEKVKVRFSQNGELVALGTVRYMGIWDTATGNQIDYQLNFFSGCLQARSVNGAYIASGSDVDLLMRDWDDASMRFCTAASSPTTKNEALSEDGALLIQKHTIFIQAWDLLANEMLWQIPDPHKDQEEVFVISPDNRLLFIGSQDGTITILNTADGTTAAFWIAHLDVITDLAVSSDGSLLVSSSWDGTVRIWGSD